MLNTDLHSPTIKEHMTAAAFRRNNRGIDDGADVPPDVLDGIFKRIQVAGISTQH